MADKHRYFQFQRYPKYKAMYIKTFDKMLKAREERGMKELSIKMTSGEEVFVWWMGEDINQMSFF